MPKLIRDKINELKEQGITKKDIIDLGYNRATVYAAFRDPDGSKYKATYADNREKILAQKKIYQSKEAVKERRSILHKKRYAENKEESSIYQRKWYENNKEEISIYQRKWYENNKEEISAKHKKRYAESPAAVIYEEFRAQGCVECKETNHRVIQAAHLHQHKNNNKKPCPSNLVAMGREEELKEELNLCIPLCGNCHTKYDHHERKTHVGRNVKMVRDLKTGENGALKQCTDCKRDFAYFQLHFDHRVPEEKEFTISSAASGHLKYTKKSNQRITPALIEEEIKKCDLVCVNCHKLRTDKQNSN